MLNNDPNFERQVQAIKSLALHKQRSILQMQQQYQLGGGSIQVNNYSSQEFGDQNQGPRLAQTETLPSLERPSISI